MAELQERLEALERRMERAEAALQLHGVPVLFEDVAVRFSRQEWASLDEGQKEMYRSVMEGNYEMLMSLYCALSKPELLLQLEREELSMPPEWEPEAAEVSPEPAVELAQQNCTSNEALLETETMERGCREPEESRNVAEKSENLAEESKNLVEESRSPVVPENCSPHECLANPAAAARVPGCSSPTFTTALALAAPVPLEAAAVLEELSQPTPSPPRLLSVHWQKALGQNCSPPAAGDAEAGIPTEVPQEEIAAEKPSMPKTPSEDLEEDKGLEKEAVKASGNTGQDLVADIPEEPGKEVTADACRTTGQADASPGEAEKDSCVGRPAACQRNAPREFYSCPICRKTFLLKINLLIHQRGHNNWAPYVCVHCDRKFMSQKKIRRHLRAWAANGTCQPSELEVCPSRVPCPASHPQSWAANGACQASKPEECPSRTPCPPSQPQSCTPNGSCQPSDAKVCSTQGPCPPSQPQTWAPNGSCQPSDAKVCSTQGPCPPSQPQTWAPNGSCQPSDAKVCSTQGPCPPSQPQTWAPNGSCQPLDAKVCSSQGPCPPSQPQTWAPNGSCQPSDAKVCSSQGPFPPSQPQTWAPNGSCQPSNATACPSQGPCPPSQCPPSQPQAWAPNGSFQPSDAKVCSSQGPCPPSQYPPSQPQTWAPNGSFQPSNATACPSQGPCPPSQPQTWAPGGTCQVSKPEECSNQTLCPSSQAQTPSRECGTVWQEPGPARCSLAPGKVMYTCNECLETFSNQVFLTVHQRRHTGHQHLIRCPCCNRSFAWVSDFVRQHWMHMGVRPHQCGICQKTFKRFSHLKSHQKIHRRQERPFARANPAPVAAPPAAGGGVGGQDVTPQGWGAAVRP